MAVIEKKVTVAIEGTPIRMACPKCHVESEVRGVVWETILDHVGVDPETLIDENDSERTDPFTTPIIRVCSSCRYRTAYNSRPLTTEQKARRTEYNRKRRDQINEALQLMRELKKKGE